MAGAARDLEAAAERAEALREPGEAEAEVEQVLALAAAPVVARAELDAARAAAERDPQVLRARVARGVGHELLCAADQGLGQRRVRDQAHVCGDVEVDRRRRRP